MSNLYGVVVHKNAYPSTHVNRAFHFDKDQFVTFFEQRKYADAYQLKMAQEYPGYNVYVIRGVSIAKSQSTQPVRVEITDKDEILPQD